MSGKYMGNQLDRTENQTHSKFRAFSSLSLRNKLIIVLIGIIAVAAIVVGGFTLYTVYTKLNVQVKNEQMVDVRTKAANIDVFLSSAQSDAVFLSQSSALTHYLAYISHIYK